MKRKEFVLACLSTGNGELFSPVQVQKMFFLFDKKISNEIGGPHFKFLPYNYGPFDVKVYEILNELNIEKDVDIVLNKSWKEYRLTSNGQKKGEEYFNQFPVNIKEFIKGVSNFVRKLSFTDLIRTIYKHYPDMKTNSVF